MATRTRSDIVNEVREHLAGEWIPEIYRTRVRTQRTRSINLEVPLKENTVDINYTLLGIELKVGKRRFACPDLAAARYMRVFARIGSTQFAIPYDITRISVVADELETSWQRSIIRLDEALHDRPARFKSQCRSALVTAVRTEVDAAGAGEAMPAFDRPTRQRS